MLRNIVLQTIIFLLILGCSSKKLKQEHEQSQVQAAATTDLPINFDPQGSDSQKINGLNTIHFQYDSSSIPQKERKLLAKNAEWIAGHAKVKVQIEGHCDEQGSVEYNLALGDRRAKAAYKFLLDLGVNAKQMATISYGKEKPLSTEDSDEAQAKNRRVNFVPNR